MYDCTWAKAYMYVTTIVTAKQWSSGTAEQRYDGMMEQLKLCAIKQMQTMLTTKQWNSETMEQRNNGTAEQWSWAIQAMNNEFKAMCGA